MARASAGGGAPKSQFLCKYFASNICERGDSCPFSHDRNAQPNRTCTYYLAGHCTYGVNCRYDHKRPPFHEKIIKKPTNFVERTAVEAQPKSWIQKKPTDVTSSVVARTHKFSADAKEFIPSWLKTEDHTAEEDLRAIPLCPYFETGNCTNDHCPFIHGNICEFCNVPCLHPFDEMQRKQHHIECVAAHEAAMNEAFAEARSADKVCGICMENIREKNGRFGILVGCHHCFCLDCIRKWRAHHSTTIDKKTVRSCPECRTHSDYVVPAEYWVDSESEKRELIDKFHSNTKMKECKYWKQGGVEECPFGNKCFYKHQMPDGEVVEGSSPSVHRRNIQLKRVGDFLESYDSWPVHMLDLLSDINSDDNFGGYSS